jgi:hypothetical protein
MKKSLCYLIIAIICIITFSGCSIGINKAKDEGIAFLKEKNYTSALSKFNEVLSKDNNNSDAITLKNLSENCIVLTNKYNNNEFSNVIETYDLIKVNPNFNIVSTDITNMYNDAKKKPNLKLKYVVYDSEEFDKSNYYEDGKGELLLASSKKNELQGNAFVIDNTRPLTEVLFQIENLGMNPAEDVVLNFKFNKMAIEFEPGNPKWIGVSSIHGLGLWNEVKFVQTAEPLYKDVPIKFTFSFKNSLVFSDANIEVTLLAKDCTPKKFTIPVKVKQFQY